MLWGWWYKLQYTTKSLLGLSTYMILISSYYSTRTKSLSCYMLFCNNMFHKISFDSREQYITQLLTNIRKFHFVALERRETETAVEEDKANALAPQDRQRLLLRHQQHHPKQRYKLQQGRNHHLEKCPQQVQQQEPQQQYLLPQQVQQQQLLQQEQEQQYLLPQQVQQQEQQCLLMQQVQQKPYRIERHIERSVYFYPPNTNEPVHLPDLQHCSSAPLQQQHVLNPNMQHQQQDQHHQQMVNQVGPEMAFPQSPFSPCQHACQRDLPEVQKIEKLKKAKQDHSTVMRTVDKPWMESQALAEMLVNSPVQVSTGDDGSCGHGMTRWADHEKTVNEATGQHQTVTGLMNEATLAEVEKPYRIVERCIERCIERSYYFYPPNTDDPVHHPDLEHCSSAPLQQQQVLHSNMQDQHHQQMVNQVGPEMAFPQSPFYPRQHACERDLLNTMTCEGATGGEHPTERGLRVGETFCHNEELGKFASMKTANQGTTGKHQIEAGLMAKRALPEVQKIEKLKKAKRDHSVMWTADKPRVESQALAEMLVNAPRDHGMTRWADHEKTVNEEATGQHQTVRGLMNEAKLMKASQDSAMWMAEAPKALGRMIVGTPIQGSTVGRQGNDGFRGHDMERLAGPDNTVNQATGEYQTEARAMPEMALSEDEQTGKLKKTNRDSVTRMAKKYWAGEQAFAQLHAGTLMQGSTSVRDQGGDGSRGRDMTRQGPRVNTHAIIRGQQNTNSKEELAEHLEQNG